MTMPDRAETSVGEHHPEGPSAPEGDSLPLPPGHLESYSLETLDAFLDG